ncbi:MAG: hypothetical protein QGH83_12780 [Candidatus Pacebacteria bacterium]|nr:hypothetical protein [Candidatus Paceibacterota bacterium]
MKVMLTRYIRQIRQPKSVESTPTPFSVAPIEPLSNPIPSIPYTEEKCEFDSTHILEKVYLESGPHSCKIVCVGCGNRWVKWSKDTRSNPYTFENDDDNHNLDDIFKIK